MDTKDAFLSRLQEACTELIQDLPKPTNSGMETWRDKFDADLEAAMAKPKPQKGLYELTDKELLDKYDAIDFRRKMRSFSF